MEGTNMAERLSEYSASVSYSDLDERVVLEAKKRLVDSIGCAIGAFREGPVAAARGLASKNYRTGDSTILGTKVAVTPDMATLVNGLMVRYFDFNDTYLSKEPAHPSDNIAPCLAVGEMEGVSGKDLILAVVLAYEIQCRLCDAASLRTRGWDHVCYGLVSSALGAGKALRLSKKETTQAVNISLNSHLAMRQVRAGELSDWKGFSFANAARNAVVSVLLARAGITGPSPVFEGEMGFFSQVSGPFDLPFEEFGRRGKSFELAKTFLKFYPAEYHAQTAIEAALEARKEMGEDRRISSVEVETHEAGYSILAKDREKWAPSTRETADHSLPYIVAAALLKGRIDVRAYAGRNLRDPELLSLLGRITVREDGGMTAGYPGRFGNRITVTLDDGTVIRKQADTPRGHPGNPMSVEEIEAKFRGLVKRSLSGRRADEVLGCLWDFERVKDVSALPAMCVAKAG